MQLQRRFAIINVNVLEEQGPHDFRCHPGHPIAGREALYQRLLEVAEPT